LTEKELTGRLKQGDKDAYRELVSLSSRRIYNIALTMLQNREDAEDITQEVFVEVWRSVPGFNEKSKLSTWICRIAVSKSLELIRSRNRKKRKGIILSIFGKEEALHMSETSPFYHPGVKLENKERAAILFGALEKIPLTQKTAFTLHKTENFSYEEIAEIMGVSVSSVESLMFRAKQNLRKLLSDYYEQNER
jgi:RNA polymerase sigma factor (sigma-70 family)